MEKSFIISSGNSWSQLTNICPSLPSCTFPHCASQLEESEFTCAAAVKARKGMEIEIEDLHIQMEDVVKTKMAVSFQIRFYNSVVL